jgi:hypothetical protein
MVITSEKTHKLKTGDESLYEVTMADEERLNLTAMRVPFNDKFFCPRGGQLNAWVNK